MDFSKLTAYMDTLHEHDVPGCDIAVYRNHELLYRHMAGVRDEAGESPIRGDETYMLYSCTKVFTTCAAMQLIGKGRLRLDDAVADYLPAYGHLMVKDGDSVRPAKRTLTLRHLMSMQSGLDYDMDTPAINAALAATDNKATTRELVDAKAKSPLCFEPGEDFQYSLSHDVLAAVIEVAAQQRFSDYLREHIFEPLDLRTMTFAPGETDRSRQCAQYIYDEEKGCKELCGRFANHLTPSPNYESGGAGLIGDVRDCSLFVDALACGGVGRNGARVLSPEMLQLWSANQLGPRSRASFDQWNRKGYSYALGVRTRVSTDLGGPGQVGEFGWDGAAGSWMMIDPVNHLSAFFAMHVRSYGYVYDGIHPTIRGLIYDALR